MGWFSPPPPPPPPPSSLELLVSLLSDEALVHHYAGWVMILTGACVIFVEVILGMRAPYGKHGDIKSAKWYGPTIHPKAAWIFQESWSFLIPAALLLSGTSDEQCLAAWPNRALLAMYMGHYAYRAFVFPLRMRGGKPMPIGVCLLAACFCVFNGYLQGRAWTAHAGPITVDSAASSTALIAGATLWALGLFINLHSDAVLRNLRKPGESGYKIPRGGAFEYVSGANYFGEILEWCGYAIASGLSLPAVAFAFFTFANTAPRAYHHHLWYREKFDDYPKQRRAVIPYVW